MTEKEQWRYIIDETVKFAREEMQVKLDERDREVEGLKEELAGNADILQGWHDDYHALYEENQRLRKALEFYANKKNNDWKIDSFDDVIPSKVMDDSGDIARKALAGEETE